IGIHPLIEKLPNSYETSIGVAAKYLSPSQLRMIEFARATFGDPTLIVLDNADVGLDGPGAQALLRLVTWARQQDRILVMASDRQAFVQDLDQLLVLWNGTMEGIVKPERLISTMQEIKQVTSRR
ncbi:MAG: hypothetical protein ACR2RE_26710, partial [Geminicoccaceae bacterium]